MAKKAPTHPPWQEKIYKNETSENVMPMPGEVIGEA